LYFVQLRIATDSLLSLPPAESDIHARCQMLSYIITSLLLKTFPSPRLLSNILHRLKLTVFFHCLLRNLTIIPVTDVEL
ncbi:hypothetical protein NPIL_244981, partial [Nephila pilipes]